ncbi:helix-turn-helix transcriptional regulator [Ruminococcus gauvreauii]|uniref:AraC family transcriptional regulator n=1 Tax=Ruminococcus gauvreauii TaxID=438033 RepID=A0ABY5VDY9_9FIRM|nr:AraC family transcriptional regulator [Ruminococcus gauvreauii]UWP58208.1 AraC family transcriptional regulator [Ruminococcus gauvreauii]
MAEMMKHIVYDEEERRMLPPDVPHLMHINDNEWMENGHLHLMHQHSDCFEVLLIHKGRGLYTLGYHQYEVCEGDIILCNSNTVHEEVPKTWQGYQTLCFAITNLCMPGLPSNHLIDERQCPVFHQPDQFHDICTLMKMMDRHARSMQPGDREICQNLMLSCMALINQMIEGRQEQTVPKERSLCIEVEDYIGRHYSEDLTLETLGKEFHISSYYLAHLFKEQTGYTLKQYIIRRRIGEAQSLLMDTKTSVTDIAERVGFEDAGHFSRLFSKYAGMSPSEYRNKRTRKT